MLGWILRILGWGVAALVVLCVGGWLLLQRGDIPWATLEGRYANAASRHMDMPGGVRVHYRDQGNPNGPVLVMIHGFGASLHAWEPWVGILGDHYRIVSLDLPAHGLTRAPSTYAMSLDHNADLVDQVTRRLNLGPYVAVGNSMGGGVAWSIALRHPDRVRGLVLVDAVGGPMQGGNRSSPLIFQVLANPIGRALIRNIDTRGLVAPGLRAAYVDPALVTPALISRYVDLSRAPGHRDIILNSRGGPGPAGAPRPRFADIHVPTLLLHGDADALIPLASGRGLAAEIPGSRLIVYPGVGHVPMEQIPARSAADVRAFLQTLDAPAATPAETPPH